MKRNSLLFILIIGLCLISSCGNGSYVVKATAANTPNNSSSYNGYWLIDLKGAVNYPNIYKVRDGTFLYELIEMAGGFSDNADKNAVNLVTVLSSNQMIIIPSIGEEKTTLININTADVTKLSTLPGIGQAKAQNIIDYRIKTGYFKTIEEITNVTGISATIFEKIKTFICI